MPTKQVYFKEELYAKLMEHMKEKDKGISKVVGEALEAWLR